MAKEIVTSKAWDTVFTVFLLSGRSVVVTCRYEVREYWGLFGGDGEKFRNSKRQLFEADDRVLYPFSQVSHVVVGKVWYEVTYERKYKWYDPSERYRFISEKYLYSEQNVDSKIVVK